jgi:hypothetical protein
MWELGIAQLPYFVPTGASSPPRQRQDDALAAYMLNNSDSLRESPRALGLTQA